MEVDGAGTGGVEPLFKSDESNQDQSRRGRNIPSIVTPQGTGVVEYASINELGQSKPKNDTGTFSSNLQVTSTGLNYGN